MISSALENESVNRRTLSQYQRKWKRKLGLELWFDGLVQKLFASLSDNTFERLYRVISRPEVTSVINRVGDIDYPSKVVLSVIAKNPEILKYLLVRK